MRLRRAVVALVAWTFFVWTTRIGIVLGDDDLDGGEKLIRLGPPLWFTLLGAAVLLALVRRASWLPRAVTTLVTWTAFVWILRGGAILLGDHSVGFRVVHTVLAVVSIALGVLAWRELEPTSPPVPAPG